MVWTVVIFCDIASSILRQFGQIHHTKSNWAFSQSIGTQGYFSIELYPGLPVHLDSDTLNVQK